MDESSRQRQVASVRGFNRFYTRLLGLLEEDLLKSGYSLAEVRILYELAHRKGASATDLVRDLGLDPGYLSRLLKGLQGRGLVRRTSSPDDGRQSVLALTREGHEAFEPIQKASNDQIAILLERLETSDRDRLVASMVEVGRLLGQRCEAKAPFILRPPRPGDLGWIVHKQAMLYAREYGWDETYEGLVAEIGGAFFRNHDPRCERCWIAEREAEIVGCVFLVRRDESVAQLRLLYVDAVARGLGIGARLVDECIRWARQTGYSTLMLWTNDVLVSARRIYQAAGFELVSEEPHRSFGKDLVGQTWSLSLQSIRPLR